MVFKDYKYIRPDLELLKNKFNKEINVIKENKDLNRVITSINNINKLRNDFDTMEQLCSIRNSINSLDEFYEQEQEWFDENGAYVQELVVEYEKAMLASKFKDELIKKYGEHLFKLFEVEVQTFSPEIIPYIQKENKLVTKYEKLISTSKINFDGKVLSLTQMGPYKEDLNRDVRRNANNASWDFFKEHESEFDNIYDELVHVRDEMAKKLGYKNYIELGYKRLCRTDYNANDVSNYRKQVLEEITPLAQKITDMQAKRIGIDDFYYFDEAVFYKDGSPKPFGTVEEKIAGARKMYSELSNETKEFANFMFDSELTDLLAKPGKHGGGYCTYIPNYKSPFVFANFNGTSGDIDTLTHEFGHAFQVYSSRGYEVPEYYFPTLEACEIHSMSMEFFTWPWMNLFFKDADKYRYFHLSGSITFIPYGVTVDEFQHVMYEHPELTPAERKKCFREIEKKYMPYRKYDNEFLEQGNWWLRQSHIFSTAFYYIDYTLAQNCAHQFFIKNLENHNKAWDDYFRLCKKGGSESFLDLLKVANLNNPFKEGTLKKTAKALEDWLDKVDANKL